MKTEFTFKADIYIGLREGYSGIIHNDSIVFEICQKYCNEVKLGLTLTKTKFIYVDGNEPGFIIGLINYPRFPDTEENIKNKAITLAKILMKELKQERCSIVCPDKTYMLEREDLNEI